MTPRNAFLLLVTVLLVSSFCCAGETVGCPNEITVTQALAAPIPGWTAMQDDAPHSLAGITFYDGPPAEKASLVYDQITRSKGQQIATWHFAPQDKRQVWLACSYAGASIELTRKLPANITTCSVTYDSQQHIGGLPVIKKIDCKP